MKLGNMEYALACLVSNFSTHISTSQRATQGFIAKKLCPELIFVANTFSRYSDMSNKVMTIFKRYDPNMSPAGCDEGYLKYDFSIFWKAY